jgi:[ribosomal protein S5]-alanine N-acetyltransferase
MPISYYDATQATSIQEAAEMQAKINNDYTNGLSIHWGIADKDSNEIKGTCGFYRGFANDSGELGCILLPKYQGMGIMSSALKLAIDYGFHTMALHKIFAITNRDNVKAIHLLKKLQFTQSEENDGIEIKYEIHNSH